MPEIHLFGGEKGGVGKTLANKTFVQYHLDKELDFVAYETDRSAPDVAKAYSDIVGVETAIFSESIEHEDSPNKIYNAALERPVIVNLSASSLQPVINWIRKQDLLELAAEEGVKFYFWFVCSGEVESVELLHRSLKEFGEEIPHILVKNWGMTSDWSLLEVQKKDVEKEKETSTTKKLVELPKLIRQLDVKVCDFPEFVGRSTCIKIRDNHLSLGYARETKDFSSIERQRVKKFLRLAYEAFESVGVLPGAQP